MKFYLHFFLVLAVEILRLMQGNSAFPKKKKNSFCNQFWKRTMFLFSHNFIFYAILEFQQTPCQL